MNPRTFTDRDGNELTVRECCDDDLNPSCAHVEIDGKSACLQAADFPGVIAALYEAAGKPAPTLIEGYGDAGITDTRIGGIRIYLAANRKVGIDGDDDLPPALARQVARMLVSIADAAESAPDPAEIAELTIVLRGVTPGMAIPGEGDYRTNVARGYAETALRWMRERESAS